MNKTTIVLSLLLSLCLLMIIGCEGDITSDVSDGTETTGPKSFEAEYDYIVGYDISDYFDGVTGTFAYSNIEFTAINQGDSEIPDTGTIGYFSSIEHLQNFVDACADCYKNDEGECTGLKHELYLAAVKKFYGTGFLGTSSNEGQKGKAICFIFVEECRDWAVDGRTAGYNSDQILEGALIHELGHGRANLTHFCSENNENFIDYNHHWEPTCLMIQKLPTAACTNVSPIHEDAHWPYSFCDSCTNRLKAFTW